jgi:hypothetical protein
MQAGDTGQHSQVPEKESAFFLLLWREDDSMASWRLKVGAAVRTAGPAVPDEQPSSSKMACSVRSP